MVGSHIFGAKDVPCSQTHFPPSFYSWWMEGFLGARLTIVFLIFEALTIGSELRNSIYKWFTFNHTQN